MVRKHDKTPKNAKAASDAMAAKPAAGDIDRHEATDAKVAAGAPDQALAPGGMKDDMSDDAAPSENPERAKHAKDIESEFPEYMQRSRKSRKSLLIAIIVLVVLLVAVGVLIFLLINVSNNAASQQTQVYMEERDTVSQENADKDAATVTEKQTAVPNLIGLFGKTLDESIEYLQHGAQVASKAAGEEGSAIKQEVRVILSDEAGDSRSGTPTVYLGLNEDGKVVRAGYSVATSSLGYGSISFLDAVQNEAIIENTLKEVGLTVSEGSAVLPADKSAYSTYATDGTTLTRESYTFGGTGDASSKQYRWSATLTYDYTMANTTGNLAETIRTIYVYIEP